MRSSGRFATLLLSGAGPRNLASGIAAVAFGGTLTNLPEAGITIAFSRKDYVQLLGAECSRDENRTPHGAAEGDHA